jgi:hypothetical protein
LCDASLGLAGAVRARGDLAGARACCRGLVKVLRGSSLGHLLPRVVPGLARLEAGSGHDRRAARLVGAFQAGGGKEAGSYAAGWPLEGFHLGPELATLRARCEHEPLAAGRPLTVDQALDEALAEALASAPPWPPAEGEVSARPARR